MARMAGLADLNQRMPESKSGALTDLAMFPNIKLFRRIYGGIIGVEPMTLEPQSSA